MGKIITSPVPDFPGTITLKEGITLPLLAQWDESKMDAAVSKKSSLASNLDRFKSIIAMCERWDIQGQPELPTPETVNAKGATGENKADELRKLLQWLVYEINIHIGMETAVPKFLLPVSTDTQKTPAVTPSQPN